MKLLQKYVGLILVVLMFCVIQSAYGMLNDGNRYAAKSKLNEGKWVKIKVEENAIYKLTYSDIEKMGLNPAKTRIFGYGGWIVDEDFRKPYVDDLPEVACWTSGTGDELKSGEYLLFYGRGVVKWSYNGREYVHENNPYSTYGAYFLTDAMEGAPKRMETKQSIASDNMALSSFDDYMIHEKDEFSIAKVGRELFGENFAGRNIQTFLFNIPGIMNNDGTVSLSFASMANEVNVILSINNEENNFTDFIKATVAYSAASTYIQAGLIERIATRWTGSKNQETKVKIDHPCGVKSAYLNYIRLNMTRKLQYYGTAYTFFRNSTNANNSVRYDIQNATSDLLVFDVTDNFDTKRMLTSLSNNVLSFNVESGSIREFALVDPKQNNFPVPTKIGDLVVNQNLHGLEQIDMAIISPSAFVAEAERLAAYHKASSRNLKVVVVTPEQIYNEFSSGVPDASAYRRFMKMFYDRAVTKGDNSFPKYLLLFGNAVFDNRFIDSSCKGLNKNNFLLCYPTNESSVKTEETCPADDYFGFLDETDDGKSLGDRNLKLGIGRFPVRSLNAAKIAVNKTISYTENKDPGIWKNSVVFLADDSDTTAPMENPPPPNSTFTLHMKQMDNIAQNIMQPEYPEYMVTKIYMDAYKSENSGGKKNFNNTAKPKLMKALRDGCLVFNYTGHGGNVGLADDILTLADVKNMEFQHRLPLWITATCDFADFDGVGVSIGEEVFLNEKSAGIALFTTTRVVYSDPNLIINLQIIKNLFSKNGSVRPTLGDVLRTSKNEMKGGNSNNNKVKFVLLGDPALVLNYPEYQIVVDKVNDIQVNGDPITLQALERVNVSGYITDKNGQIDRNFDGRFSANVFDGIKTIQTVTATQPNSKSESFYSYFTDYPNLISQSHSTVKGGKFEFSFMVPKDINNITDLGKMNFYAYNNNTSSRIEAQGSFMNYKIFGMDESVDPNNEQAPEITGMYLNDSTFKSGNVVNETPFFVATVKDTFGIYISGSSRIRDIKLIVNNLRDKTYELNSFYKASLTEPNVGTVSFSIPELPEGKHRLTFQVWNILNNVAIEYLDFEVKKGLRPQLSDLKAFPSPAKIGENITFEFTHDRPETRMEVEIRVCDFSGRLIWSRTESGSSDSIYKIGWDLILDNGSDIQPGIYLYSAIVKTKEGTETIQSKKLIIAGNKQSLDL